MSPECEPTYNNVTGFLSADRTIPLPLTLEYEPAYASQLTVYKPSGALSCQHPSPQSSNPTKATKTTMNWKAILRCLFGILGVVGNVVVVRDFVGTPQQEKTIEHKTWSTSILPANESSNRKVYGHVHMAKTAGTTINGRLALGYEGVCGHKGYSYDYAGVNQGRTRDLYSERYKGYSRGRVPIKIMEEIGFENCEFISHETDWNFWKNLQVKTFSPFNISLELHVPCRDPIVHLMSQCNHLKKHFDCGGNISEQVDQCEPTDMTGRFSSKLLAIFPNTKCFSAEQVENYMVYMGSRLQKKRIQREYKHRATNLPRNVTEECIWKNATARQATLDYLQKFDHVRFCSSCLNSQNDLLNGTSTDA